MTRNPTIASLLHRIHYIETQMKIVELMRQDSRITTVRLSEIIGISKRNIEANISDLKKKGIVERIGSRKNGYWEVKEDGI